MSDCTLPAIFRAQANRLGPRPALRHKAHGLYHDITWTEQAERVEACAAALVRAGVAVGDRVAILSENRAEWLAADMAILCAGAVNVPLHTPLSARQIHYQLADAGVCWAFVSTAAQLAKLLEVRSELPGLRGIVLFEGTPPEGVASWAGFVQRGRADLAALRAELDRRQAALGPDDLATIMYTSGTTGHPKGVMLTHGNLSSNARAVLECSGILPHAVYLSWLPFSHIYARTVDIYGVLVSGALLCLAESVESVMLNLAETQPTNMSGVPRFYEKVLAAVQGGDEAQGLRRLRMLFGARVDWLSSGGAPLPPAVAQAYHAAGLLLLQGYGLTESSPVISFNRKDRYKVGSVGLPIPGVAVRIADDGEVLTRGPHVMKGYWNDPAATAEALEDGWLHTGDLGRLDEDGFLYITGRKKELLVLSNGKKVVPAHLEGLLLADPCIDQAVVCGEGRNFLSALIVPQWTNLRKQLDLDSVPETELAHDERIHAFLTGRIERALEDVSSWEQVRKIIIVPRPFSVADEELTVSLKLRRKVIVAHHKDELDALYHDDRTPVG